MYVSSAMASLRGVEVPGFGTVGIRRVLGSDGPAFMEFMGGTESAGPTLGDGFMWLSLEGWGFAVEMVGEVIGFGHVGQRLRTGRVDPWILVSPRLWGHGVGSAVLRAVLVCYRSTGAEAVIPLANLRAARMAESAGLHRVGAPGGVVGEPTVAWHLMLPVRPGMEVSHAAG